MGSNTTREQVAAAVFAVVDTAVGNVVGLKTSVRRRRLPEDVSPAQTPALFQIETKERYEYRPGGMDAIPPIRTMIFDHHIYVADAVAVSAGARAVPSTQLNAIVQAVEAAFAPDPTTNRFTMGGLVHYARIEGEIDYLESPILDGMSVVMIPVAVMIP